MTKIKKCLKQIIYNLPIGFLLRNYILFESNPDYADNPYYVYMELLKEGYNNKYKMVWFVKNKDEFKNINIPNVKFVNFNEKKAKYYRLFAKFIIDCNNYIYKLNKNQYRFYLGHGMPIKIVPSYTEDCGNLDNYLVTSEYFFDYFSKYTKNDKIEFLPLGYPRCDQFFKEKELFKELIEYNKIILWMPTYRKHQNLQNMNKSKLLYGVPSINNEIELLRLNDKLRSYKSLLIIKLHPAEDIRNIDLNNLSNILFTKNELLDNNGCNVYQLAQVCDALITDYSSMYYDFLLADKPIGMSIEDKEEYEKNNDLFIKDFEKELPAEYIYSYNDLIKFIDNVCNNKDVKRSERNAMRKKYFKYIDGNASKRVLDVLKKHSL